MNKFDLVINNADGTKYWSEGFPSKNALDLWIAEEKTRSYWKSDFVVLITDNSAAMDAAAAQIASDVAAVQVKRQAARAAIAAFKAKPSKTLPDLLQAIAGVFDILDL